MKIKFKLWQGKEDPEKAVLPTIIYCTSSYEDWRGYGIALGWWDYAAGIIFMVRSRK